MPVVVGINGFSFDTDKEKDLLKAKSEQLNVPIVSSTHWADGGAGAKELAETVVKTIDESENNSNSSIQMKCRFGIKWKQ